MIAVAVVPWLGGGAASAADAPPSLDSRATSYDGNAVTCADAGLAGDIIAVTSTEDGTYIDITAVPSGFTVTGVVVKGGSAYNVYLPGTLGALPWLQLHSPENGSGAPAGISHWYVCATVTTTTTTPPAESSTPATTPATTPVTTPATTPVTTPVTTPAASTPATSVLPTKVGQSPSTSVEGVKVPRELPHTGGSDLLGLGSLSVGLLLLGGALLAAPKFAVERNRRH